MNRILVAVLLALALAGLAGAQTHQVTLNWTASTSTVTGYNVYRLAGACPTSVSLPTFTKLTTTPVTATTFADTTVVAGSTYCYAATAVGAGGESTANGTLQVTIPVFTVSTIPAPPGAFGLSPVE